MDLTAVWASAVNTLKMLTLNPCGLDWRLGACFHYAKGGGGGVGQRPQAQTAV